MATTQDEIATPIYAAIGNALVRWARLEYGVCQVFCEALSPAAHDPNGNSITTFSPASDAFWATMSFEAKLKMTTAAVEARLSRPSQYASDSLLAEWAKLAKRVGEKSRSRNKLAHGGMLWTTNPDGSLRADYVPYYFPIMSGKHTIHAYPGCGGEMHIASSLPSEKSRMSAKRIETIRCGFDVAIQRLNRFLGALREHNTAVSEELAATRRFFESAQQGQT